MNERRRERKECKEQEIGGVKIAERQTGNRYKLTDIQTKTKTKKKGKG